MPVSLKIWLFGCSHIGNDIQHGRRTMELAAQDAESVGFDIAVNMGDVSGQQGEPRDSEGQLWRDQIASGLRNHLPADIYSVAGNHDRTAAAGLDCGEWFQRWIDPMGKNSAESGVDDAYRIFVPDGKWHRYKIEVGNVRMLFLSDVNRPLTPRRGVLGGDPGGVVTTETYQWWKEQCTTNKIVMTFAHYMPHETTCATGYYEGGTVSNGEYSPIYHGPGISEGRVSSFLAYVDEVEGTPFIDWMEAHPGSCNFWFGAHNHVRSGQMIGGKGHVVTKYGCTFVQTGHLTRYHAAQSPKSRFITLANGSSDIHMDAYFHDNTIISKGLNPNFKTISAGNPIFL